MAITAENNGGNYTPMPQGNYVARCYQMIEIGTVEEEFQGEKKTAKKVRLGFEFPTELKVFKEENGEQPYVLSKEFTLSMHEKSSLRKFLEAWRGKSFADHEAKSFDITVLLNKPCMINVVHKDSDKGTRANISSVGAMPKGLACPEQINPTMLLSYDSWNQDLFESMPDFIKDKIKSSKEYKKMFSDFFDAPKKEAVNDDSDLPF